jgi:threonine/homoserine/homoserine lactone efflux protein
MPPLTNILLFMVAAITLLAIPGPAVIYIVTRSVSQGRAAGIASVLGIHVGTAVYVAATSMGISALLAASATAFLVVKYLGASYLIWLGVQKLRRRKNSEEPSAGTADTSLRRVFCQGVVVNILNPKTLIFFTAFLPQFVDQQRGFYAGQLAFFGALFIMLGIVSDGTYALLSSALAGRLRRSSRLQRRLDRYSGAAYLALGVFAALVREA